VFYLENLDSDWLPPLWHRRFASVASKLRDWRLGGRTFSNPGFFAIKIRPLEIRKLRFVDLGSAIFMGVYIGIMAMAYSFQCLKDLRDVFVLGVLGAVVYLR